jgi:hypothetical protein
VAVSWWLITADGSVVERGEGRGKVILVQFV